MHKTESSDPIVNSDSIVKLNHYDDGTAIDLEHNTILKKLVPRRSRQGWEDQFQAAIAAGELPEQEMLEGFSNDFDKNDWIDNYSSSIVN